MIKVAILGAGIGAEHLAGYRNLPGDYNVVVMCDLDAARAKAATENDPSIKIISDIEAVMADPDIDLIDICLPPHLHVPIALQALSVGKHVICEKPIARSLAEIDQLEDALSKTDARIFPVFQYRFGLGFEQVQAVLNSGLAGKPLVATAETHWNRLPSYYEIAWRGTWAGEAGGALLSHAIHAHDLISFVLGPVSALHAFTDTRVNEIETEDCASISMKMQNGALVTSSVTLGAAQDTSRFRFCFENLTIESGLLPYTPSDGRWIFTARGDANQEEIDAVIANVEAPLSGFSGFLKAISDAVGGNAEKEVSFADGRRSIEFVTAVYLSAREGRLVNLPISENEKLYAGWSPDITN
jgi:predicted dehydrogenase